MTSYPADRPRSDRDPDEHAAPIQEDPTSTPAPGSASPRPTDAAGADALWSGRPAPTATPFWRDDVTRVEAPLYRGSEPPATLGAGPAANTQAQPPSPWISASDGHPADNALTAYDNQGALNAASAYDAPAAYDDQAAYAAASAYPYPAGSYTSSYTSDAGGTPPNGTVPPASDAPFPQRPRRIRRALVGTAVAAAVIGGAAGAGTYAAVDHNNSSSSAAGLTITNSTAPAAAVTKGTISSAAAAITPSVVTIQVTGSSESGTGSGVILRSDGYILTNDHVVSVAGTTGSIVVQTSDGRSAKATIVGTDTTDDLAVIKVTGLTALKAATFANSSSLTVGQSVVAVGAPLGLSDTVTAGIVSATARTVRSGDNDQAVFAAVQTDAAINPGNSGGALVDLNGDVVGINAAIASTGSSGVTVPGQQATQSGSIGIGFAIPSNEASRIAAELIKTGKASHAVLGVEVASSSSTTSTGATLAGVTAGGAAAAAGLKTGDVVTAVDGSRISTGDDLIAAIRSHAVKDTVTVTYTRGGASHTVKVTLTASSS